MDINQIILKIKKDEKLLSNEKLFLGLKLQIEVWSEIGLDKQAPIEFARLKQMMERIK